MTHTVANSLLLPNRALSEARAERRLSAERLAHLVCMAADSRQPPIRLGTRANVTRHIKRIESGSVRRPGSDYRSLLCVVLGKSEVDLFGETIAEPLTSDQFSVSSHKFVPCFVGHSNAVKLIRHYGLVVDPQQRSPRRFFGPLPLPHGACHLYVYSFGVALFQLDEFVRLPSIAGLARWRLRSYTAVLQWVTERLSDALGDSVAASYVLSLYRLEDGIWGSSELGTAMRLLCMPRVLLGEAPAEDAQNAEQVEAALFRNGFGHPDITEFGVMGLSMGCASWSGVSYYPIAPARALPMNELVEVELLVQALWCYCNHIIEQDQQGHVPAIPAEYGFRFLRGSASLCSTARPQESAQHRSMREAILATSDLGAKLRDALAILRDA